MGHQDHMQDKHSTHCMIALVPVVKFKVHYEDAVLLRPCGPRITQDTPAVFFGAFRIGA